MTHEQEQYRDVVHTIRGVLVARSAFVGGAVTTQKHGRIHWAISRALPPGRQLELACGEKYQWLSACYSRS